MVADQPVRGAVQQRVDAHQPPQDGPAAVRQLEVARHGDQHQLARSCPGPGCPRGRAAPPRADRSRRRSPRARPRRRREHVAQRLAEALGLADRCISQNPMTPRLVAISLPGLTVGAPSAPDCPKWTRRPKCATALRLCSKVSPADHLEDHVERGALVGLDHRLLEVVGVGVDGRVRPEPLASSRFSGLEARPITRPGAEALGELDRDRPDAAGGGEHRHALALAAAGRLCAAGARRWSLEDEPRGPARR